MKYPHTPNIYTYVHSLSLHDALPILKVRAAACFRIAAGMGLDWGMYNYATLLALGEGVDEDKAAAFGWLEKAAAMVNAKAINFVVSFHADGWAVTRDVDQAADCYARPAAGGDFRGRFNHVWMHGFAGKVDSSAEDTSDLHSLMAAWDAV